MFSSVEQTEIDLRLKSHTSTNKYYLMFQFLRVHTFWSHGLFILIVFHVFIYFNLRSISNHSNFMKKKIEEIVCYLSCEHREAIHEFQWDGLKHSLKIS